jgi:hypothetical protein
MEFVLILFMFIGALSDKDSMALTTVVFKSQAECETAGQKAVTTFARGTKQGQFVCVARKA